MLQEMKDVPKSNCGLGVHLLHYNMWSEDQELSLLLSICISWEMICWAQQGWQIFEFLFMKNSKIWKKWYAEWSEQKKNSTGQK